VRNELGLVKIIAFEYALANEDETEIGDEGMRLLMQKEWPNLRQLYLGIDRETKITIPFQTKGLHTSLANSGLFSIC
jgi:hypothetical protein